MKNITFLILLSFISTLTSFAGDFEMRLNDFRLIKVMGNYKVKLIKSTENKIKINNKTSLDDERIVAEVEGNELIVRVKRDTYKERDIEVTIYYTKIFAVTASKGAVIEGEDVLTGDLVRLDAEYGGKIKLGVNCETLQATIATGGSIHINGRCDFAKYEVAAGGTIGAVSVDAFKVDADIRAGGEIICKVTDELKVKILSGGTVSYLGNPKGLEQDITLGGNITKLKGE